MKFRGFQFEEFDGVCAQVSDDELQLKHQHYTRALSSATTSAAFSTLAAGPTGGISMVGALIAGPLIHNARKKRQLVEEHMTSRGLEPEVRRKDKIIPMVIGGAVGAATMGVGSIGAEALAGAGIEALADKTAAKLVLHTALDAGATVAEEHYLKKKSGKEREKLAASGLQPVHSGQQSLMPQAYPADPQGYPILPGEPVPAATHPIDLPVDEAIRPGSHTIDAKPYIIEHGTGPIYPQDPMDSEACPITPRPYPTRSDASSSLNPKAQSSKVNPERPSFSSSLSAWTRAASEKVESSSIASSIRNLRHDSFPLIQEYLSFLPSIATEPDAVPSKGTQSGGEAHAAHLSSQSTNLSSRSSSSSFSSGQTSILSPTFSASPDSECGTPITLPDVDSIFSGVLGCIDQKTLAELEEELEQAICDMDDVSSTRFNPDAQVDAAKDNPHPKFEDPGDFDGLVRRCSKRFSTRQSQFLDIKDPNLFAKQPALPPLYEQDYFTPKFHPATYDSSLEKQQLDYYPSARDTSIMVAFATTDVTPSRDMIDAPPPYVPSDDGSSYCGGRATLYDNPLSPRTDSCVTDRKQSFSDSPWTEQGSSYDQEPSFNDSPSLNMDPYPIDQKQAYPTPAVSNRGSFCSAQAEAYANRAISEKNGGWVDRKQDYHDPALVQRHPSLREKAGSMSWSCPEKYDQLELAEYPASRLPPPSVAGSGRSSASLRSAHNGLSKTGYLGMQPAVKLALGGSLLLMGVTPSRQKRLMNKAKGKLMERR